MPLAAGTRLGPYEILAPIGAGGMGEVYKARDMRLDRTVAVKVANERFSERFEREARTIAALNHPHICALFDVGPNYLVMEYVDGTPLRGPLPLDKALPLAFQIVTALEEAHQKGITHRDLKPANILLTASGVKLLDFGLAKVEPAQGARDSTVTQTHAGTILGTAAYMSPEQASGKPADPRSDIFSFGAVLYELLSGQQAFQGETQITTMAAVLRDEPRPLPATSEIVAVVNRCLRKSPGDRYQTAAELKTALATVKPADAAPSIAVLPFVNMSADRENEYFSDGLSEEIINALTKIPGLRVIARTSAFRFRGEQDLRKVGEALQVGHILEGSVRKAGNRLRITAQLIRVADDSHIWSERYDRELTDIFAIQDEIAAAIVEQLKASLAGQTPAKRKTTNLAAYESVLEGRYHWYRFTPQNAAKALACFERAVALDPNCAPAHVGLAFYYHQAGGGFGAGDPHVARPKARAAAERAVALDPNEGEAHAALAQAIDWMEFDWAKAERHWRRALALAPSTPFVHATFGTLHLCPRGKLEEGLAEIDLSLQLDPLSALFWVNRAYALNCVRRFEEAAASCQRALDLEPGYLLALFLLASTRAYQGRPADALEAAERLNRIQSRFAPSLTALGIAHATSGNRGEAHRVLRKLRELALSAYVGPSNLAQIHAQLGELDEAFEWAGRAIEQRDNLIRSVNVWPGYDPLRSDPRYSILLRKMNLK